MSITAFKSPAMSLYAATVGTVCRMSAACPSSTVNRCVAFLCDIRSLTIDGPELVEYCMGHGSIELWWCALSALFSVLPPPLHVLASTAARCILNLQHVAFRSCQVTFVSIHATSICYHSSYNFLQ